MELEHAYEPPGEPVLPAAPEPEHVPPAGFVDYWEWHRIRDDAGGVATGRLATFLREAARSSLASKLRAACLRRLEAGAEAADAANALTDLAVSGRSSFQSFQGARPDDEEVLADLLRASAGLSEERARRAVTATLDRAYSVAWALRGEPAHRRALRAGLGWIAVSSEDDPPHAPCNIGCTEDTMGDLTLSVPAVGSRVICRAAIKLPRPLASGPLPPIASRSVPSSDALQRMLSAERADHYDELALFLHGLGSRLEESDAYKQHLIERAAARGTRLAVLSIDLPGMGYSARLNIPDLVRRRARGHHGFALPNGAGSNFPLLGLLRDAIVQLSSVIAGGIQYVMGGSLGGNLTLWLAEAPMFTALPSATARMESAKKFASWSPGSIWESYERSRDTPFEDNGTHMDIGKNGAKKRARERMNRGEDEAARKSFFEPMQRGEDIFGLHVLGAWGYPPTKGGLLQQAELYGEEYRRTFWTAAYEQVVFSHQEPIAGDGTWPFSTIDRPLLIASGALDVGSSGVMDIYNQVVRVTDHATSVSGRRLLMSNTGHSISDERPKHLADEVGSFFFGGGWVELDHNRATAQIAAASSGESVVAASDALYRRTFDGTIARFDGRLWQVLDRNARTRAIAAGRGQLFQLHVDGKIWRYTGTPMRWELIDDNRSSREIVASDEHLYQLHHNGAIWRYAGTHRNWELLDDNPRTRSIACARGALYQLHGDGKLWRNLSGGRGWELIDDNPRTRAIVAAGGALFQLHVDAKIFRFEGVPRRFQLIDDNVRTRALVATEEALYQLHADGKVFRYLGAPRSWELLDQNVRTRALTAAEGALYQIHADGAIWRYNGTPVSGWERVSEGAALAPSGLGVLFQAHEDGTSYRYEGGRQWARLGSGVGIRQLVAGEHLYQRHADGKVWRHIGPGNAWELLDRNPATIEIAAGGAQLYQLHADGKIWRYKGGLADDRPWELLDENPSARAIAAGGNQLYQLHADGKVWRHTGGLADTGPWELLDDNCATRAIVATESQLFQLHADGKIWRYAGGVRDEARWELLDDNRQTQSIVAVGDDLHQLHRNGTIFRYMGGLANAARWELLDDNPASRRIAAGRGPAVQLREGLRITRFEG